MSKIMQKLKVGDIIVNNTTIGKGKTQSSNEFVTCITDISDGMIEFTVLSSFSRYPLGFKYYKFHETVTDLLRSGLYKLI